MRRLCLVWLAVALAGCQGGSTGPANNMTVLYGNASANYVVVTWLTPGTRTTVDTVHYTGGGGGSYVWNLPGFRTDTVYPYQHVCVHFYAPLQGTDSVGPEYIMTATGIPSGTSPPSTGSWQQFGLYLTTATAWGFDGTLLLPVGTSYQGGTKVMQGC